MKKSEMYRIAQLAVLKDDSIRCEDKLEILAVLLDDEDLEKFREKEAEKE